jgi:hypothetical protein
MDRFDFQMSVGTPAYTAQVVNSIILNAFAAGGQVAGLKAIAAADAAWVADGSLESPYRIATIASWYAYADEGAPIGFTRGQTYRGDNDSKAVAFNPKDSPGSPSWLAFRGTVFSSEGNRETDRANLQGEETAAHQWAVKTGTEWAKSNPNGMFTGHSLGGGLAAIAALSAAGFTSAITINAAGVSEANLNAAGVVRSDAAGRVRNLSINGEFVGMFDRQAALGQSIPIWSPVSMYWWASSLLGATASIQFHRLEFAAPLIMRYAP